MQRSVPRLRQRARLRRPSNRAAILQRMLYDVSDALQFERRTPKVAAGALAFAALGAFGLLRER